MTRDGRRIYQISEIPSYDHSVKNFSDCFSRPSHTLTCEGARTIGST